MSEKSTKSGLKGRPSAGKSVELSKEIALAFSSGWTVDYAASKLKYNRQTIMLHYRELREKQMEELNDDFAQEQRHHKEVCMTKLDRMIDRLENELGIIDLKIAENGNDMEYEWRKYRLELIDRVAILAQQKTDIQMRPTIDIDLDKMIEERLAELEEIESKKPTPVK